MKNLQTKYIFFTSLIFLIVSGTYANSIIELKNNSNFSSKIFSLNSPSTNLLLLKVSEYKGDLPQSAQITPIENNDENNDDDSDDYARFCYLSHSLIERLNSSTICFENTDSPRAVPLYILFHSWKNFLL